MTFLQFLEKLHYNEYIGFDVDMKADFKLWLEDSVNQKEMGAIFTKLEYIAKDLQNEGFQINDIASFLKYNLKKTMERL